MQKYRGKEYELKISRTKMEDKGEYIVKAENSFGRREELGILKVDRELYILLLGFCLFKFHYNLLLFNLFVGGFHFTIEFFPLLCIYGLSRHMDCDQFALSI